MRHSLPADAQSLDVSAPNSHIPTIRPKVLSKLPMPVQRIIAEMLIRVRDSEPEGTSTSDTSSQQAVGSGKFSWGWLPLLSLSSALGIFSVTYTFTSLRYGRTGVEFFFWLGLLLIFVPPMVRLLSPAASRFERLSLLCVVDICFYLVQVLDHPFSFYGHDAFLHTRTVDDIARSGHLFTANSLLPASPFYPGLEIVTNAFSTLSGLNIFFAGFIVLGIACLVMILSLFLLYEQITKSARMAGIATMLYMANPHFLFFDTSFGYESLALPLATLMLFAAARQEFLKIDRRWITLTALIPLAAVVVTHHMTSFVFDGLLAIWTVSYAFLQPPIRLHQSNLAKLALFGIFASVAWALLPGNPVVGYLSSYYGSALSDLGHVVSGVSSARHLFTVYVGQPIPLWERAMAISSIALILLVLPLGLLCIWQRYRYNALAFTFGIVSLFYPISHVFRLTISGSEITDRAAAFLFIPVSCVLTIFIAQFWPTQGLSRKQTSLITCALSVIFLGGVVLGAGQSSDFLPGPYLVAADARSIEPEGIQAALWVPSHLGPNQRIATDRTNQLLMSTYGDQYVITSLADNVDVTSIFFSPSLGPKELLMLRSAHIRYLVVDLRLSTSLPYLGFYFEPGEPGAFQHATPISREALTKFNTMPQVNLVFDSGDIVIYNVGGLSNAPEKP
jgi:hypothetical protein